MKYIILGGEQKHQSVKTDGICTCLTSSMGTGGGYVPMIVYFEEVQIVSDRDKECVKLFDLPKEICHDLECHRRVYSVKASTPTLNARSDSTKILEIRGVQNKMQIKVRQATKNGFVECEVPGVVDLNYDTSTTRRGRVVEGGADKSSSDNGEYP